MLVRLPRRGAKGLSPRRIEPTCSPVRVTRFNTECRPVPGQSSDSNRRHDRRLSDAQRDERVKLEVDAETALKHLLGVAVDDPPEASDEDSKAGD